MKCGITLNIVGSGSRMARGIWGICNTSVSVARAGQCHLIDIGGIDSERCFYINDRSIYSIFTSADVAAGSSVSDRSKNSGEAVCGSVTGGGRHVRCDCDAGSESWIFGTENSRVGARRNREGGRGAVRVAPPCEQPAREVSAAGAPPRRQLGYFTRPCHRTGPAQDCARL
ncbi:hypothetical protein HW555_000283 [Spodoptera exigua]|uniref:Uncharacterized protein n=1 Tax=Spodoptera exigua TaxID=7107 RepID=A0A835LGC0_SPOEX|nr:hypothetical protein HW555_000283 [Spodoptera exigua]